MGFLGKFVKYHQNSFYLFIPKKRVYTLFLGTHLQVRTVGGLLRLMVQTTRTCARMFLLGFHLYCSLWVKFSQNPDFGGTNRRFQSKHAKNSNFHIFVTTASTATKFCTVIKTTKYLRGCSRYARNKSKMADGLHL